MKIIHLVITCIVALQASAQVSVQSNRTTHLLKERNQGLFSNDLVIQNGETIELREFYLDGYFKVRYKHEEYFIYYPYFSELNNIESIKSQLLVNETHAVDQPKPKQINGEKQSSGHVIHTGPRGGRYYINSSGNKTYIKD